MKRLVSSVLHLRSEGAPECSVRVSNAENFNASVIQTFARLATFYLHLRRKLRLSKQLLNKCHSSVCMKENNPQSLPSFASLDEHVEFFDTNDMGDYLDEMPEANFDVDIKRRTHLVAIDEELVVKLNEIARLKQIPAESLVNSWLKEKISDYPEKT